MNNINSVYCNGMTFTTGDKVSFSYGKNKINDAKIYIGDTFGGSIRVYLCHNYKELEGAASPYKFGYKYSWVIYIGSNGKSTFPDLKRINFDELTSVINNVFGDSNE